MAEIYPEVPPTRSSIELEYIPDYAHSGTPMDADWEYNPRDPYAVQVTFLEHDKVSVQWKFARGLIEQGLNGSTEGTMDAQFYAHPYNEQIIILRLSPPGKTILLAMARDKLERFLFDSYAVVPPGAESEAAQRELDSLTEAFWTNDEI